MPACAYSTKSGASPTKHRADFIEQCHKNAWGAACHADWIRKSVDKLLADYQKLQEEDRTAEADMSELKNAVDSHTVENRNKRKALQEKRDALKPRMDFIAKAAQEGTAQMQRLMPQIDTSLALAEHARTSEWKGIKS
jgi:hypothetical protein